LIDANQCLECPNLVAREHLLDVGDGVLLGGFHAHDYDFFFIKVEQKIKQMCVVYAAPHHVKSILCVSNFAAKLLG